MMWPFNLMGNTFRHGIHPHDFKELTRHIAIQRMPFPDRVVLPLSQHTGAPSVPVVKVGDKVFRGQMIARPGGFVSSALHASMTGTVVAMDLLPHPSGRLVESMVIERDPLSPQTLFREHATDWELLSPKDLLTMISNGGFVGLGGAAFPTHVKLSVPEGKKASFLIVNGVECEPYLTSDHRQMLESIDDIILGIRVTRKVLDVERIYIGIESNKEDAIELLAKNIPADLNCQVIPLKVKYPQGAEKMLTEAVLNKEIPSGKLPIDIEVIINNVGTVAGIGRMMITGQPLIERVVTVTGPGINRPANLLIPIGTPLNEVLDYCGGLKDTTRQILFGGPMMGAPQLQLDVPVMKGTSGILCLTEEDVFDREEYPCIRCLRCVDACPVSLNPSLLGALAIKRHYEEMLDYHILDCMECGSCSYVCPSNIPLVQRFRVAKGLNRERMAKKAAQTKSA